MVDYPSAPTGGAPFVVGSGTGLREGGIYTQAQPGEFGYFQGLLTYWGQNTPSSPLPGPAGTAAATGVNPTETSYSLFGHTIPLTAFGVGRIGGEIIAGPWISGGLATFCISLGVPADPTGTRDIREIAFDSEVVWSTSGASGVTTSAGGTFSTEAFTFRFYQGTLTQTVDAVETLYFGAQANAYRPQILIWFQDLPIANTKFGKIPYVSAVIGDGTGDDVNFGEAFERLAASPFVNFSEFETSGITDGLPSGGLIFVQDISLLASIQQFARFYPQWDILQTDKLRIVDRGSTVIADIALDASTLLGSITVNRQGADTVVKDLELSTIDPEADFTIVPSVAQRPRDPVAVTTSVGKDTAYLPAIMDSSTRAAIVTLAKYHEEATRKTISGTAMAYGLQIEPGDLVTIRDLGDDFNNETFKVVETLHGANYTVEFTAAAILKCSTHDTYANFDPATAFHATVTNNNLTVSGTTPGVGGCFVYASEAKTSGKWYFEVTWSALGGFLLGGEIGVASTTATISDLNGSVNSTVLFQGNFPQGQIWTGAGYSGYSLGTIGAGNVIGVALDLDNGKVWFKNITGAGQWNGATASGDPVTNVNGVAAPSGSIIPAVGFGVNNDVYIGNFGSAAFAGAVPSGYSPWWV